MNANRVRSRSIGIALALAVVAVAGAGHAQEIDTLAIRNDTRILADDSLGGRGLGSDGARIAATYIAGRLRSIGLDPAGSDGYLLPVPVRRTTIDAGSRLEMSARSTVASFAHGRDYVHGRGAARAFGDFAGTALFAGTGDSALRILGGRNVAGHVIVIAGMLPEDADSLVRYLESAGAAALLQLVPDDAFLARYADALGPDRLWIDLDVDEPRWQPRLPILVGGTRLSRRILEAARPADAALDGQIEAPIALGWDIAVHPRATTADVAAANIVGILPGSDPVRRQPEVLYTAHYDHLGIVPGTADSVYNGFSDNAAGVAMLLAIAQSMHDRPPAATVAFAFMTGEESGLLGASAFASRPAFPLDGIRAVINLDGGAPPRPPVSWRVAGDTAAPITAIAAGIIEAHGWTPVVTGTRANSDHWPFLARGVPSVFLIPGNEWEQTTTAERDALRTEFDHYHQPGDSWRPDFPFAGLRRYATIALEIGLRMAR